MNDMTQRTDILTGIIIEDQATLSMRQLCEACAVHAEFISELVDEGVIEPAGIDRSHWVFPGITLQRIRTAKRLQRDLGINLAGVALALQLMDEMQQLRARLEVLSGAHHE